MVAQEQSLSTRAGTSCIKEAPDIIRAGYKMIEGKVYMEHHKHVDDIVDRNIYTFFGPETLWSKCGNAS